MSASLTARKRAAWWQIALAFEVNPRWRRSVFANYGLCFAVDQMDDQALRSAMRDDMGEVSPGPNGCGAFWWPWRTGEGDQCRVIMATLLACGAADD